MLTSLSRMIQQAWYSEKLLLWPLIPVAYLFELFVHFRRQAYLEGRKTIVASPCPVIVVGNINVGGSGKSPLVIWLAERLQAEGYSPGIISRGYGGKASSYPCLVDINNPVEQVGDEPWMIKQRTGLPCVVDPIRPRGVQYLYDNFRCDVIISDDGLQHYAMGRDIEIVVLDGERGLGNGYCLPVGPLREPRGRLESVDFVVVNGGQPAYGQFSMELQEAGVYAVADFQNKDKQRVNIPDGEQVHAVAGIGNPQRFFDTLARMGCCVESHPFPDHHRFQQMDLDFQDNRKILLTEKDAVKCLNMQNTNFYYLKVEAQLDEHFWRGLVSKLESKISSPSKLGNNL